MSDNDATPVTIYGRTYQLRGCEDPAYLSDLASLVDEKMRVVADATGTADTIKLAILASLNLADDYLQVRRGGQPRDDGDAAQRLARMVSLLEEAVAR